MFNVTVRQDRNLGVDFLILFCYFYLKSLDSPNTFNYQCKSHKLASLPDTSNSKLSYSFVRDENILVPQPNIFGEKSYFDNTPAEKWFGLRIFES